MNDTPKDKPTEIVERGTMKARDIRVGPSGINFTNAAEVMAFANMMAQSGFAVRKEFRNQPGACLALVDDAIRFGMSPYALARGAYMVNDQLAYESKIVAAIIIGRAAIVDLPDYAFDGTGGEMRCTVSIKLSSGRTITHTSPPVGQIGPKNSPLWKTDPEQQLGYYTIRAMARRHFPHTLAGIYDLEEIAAARAIDATPVQSGLAERLQSATGNTVDEGQIIDELHGREPTIREAAEARAKAKIADVAGNLATTIMDAQGSLVGAAEPSPATPEPADPETEPTDNVVAMEAGPMTGEEVAYMAHVKRQLRKAQTVLEVGAIYTASVEETEHFGTQAKLEVSNLIEARREKLEEGL
jgi:hypothetical protein